MNFVVDTLKESGGSNNLSKAWFYDDKDRDTIISVLKATDFDTIGLMGHSLGGATAVTVGRRSDISAVIDIDGTMLGEETGVVDDVVQINEKPYRTPPLANKKLNILR